MSTRIGAVGVKKSLVEIQTIIDRELLGSISDGDYLQLVVNLIQVLYEKNARVEDVSDEDVSDEDVSVEDVSDEDVSDEDMSDEDVSDETQHLELQKSIASHTIQTMWRKYKKQKQLSQDWIDLEQEDIFGNMFEEDDRVWTLEYLEISWKNMYRKHYGRWMYHIPGDKVTLSYWDYVSLSRGTLRN